MRYEVSAAQAGARLDTFVGESLGWSRRAAQTTIGAGAVRVNHHRGRKGDTLRQGDLVEIEEPALTPAVLQPNPQLELEVLYEDSQVVAIDKPAGMPSLALAADELDTVANFLLARYPETATVGRGRLEPGIVHRLDTGTSGILLAARTQEAWEHLRQQFSQRRVEKEYLAVVFGNLAAEASVEAPLAADPRTARRMKVVVAGSKGARRALTSYRPLQTTRDTSLLAVRIKTGVRHQIRVHLAEIGHPVVGDTLYGPPQRELGRHLLHACYLAFEHPTRGDQVEIRSAAPPEFRLGRKGESSPSRWERREPNRKR